MTHSLWRVHFFAGARVVLCQTLVYDVHSVKGARGPSGCTLYGICSDPYRGMWHENMDCPFALGLTYHAKPLSPSWTPNHIPCGTDAAMQRSLWCSNALVAHAQPASLIVGHLFAVRQSNAGPNQPITIITAAEDPGHVNP